MRWEIKICFFFSLIVMSMCFANASNSASIGIYIEGEEVTPPAGTTTIGGGGGGGTAALKPYYEIVVDQEVISVVLRTGEVIQKSFTIKNTNNVSLGYKISTNIDKTVYFSEHSFILAPHTEKTIYITIGADINEIPDVYSGKLIIEAGDSEKSLPFIIEVRSKRSLLDARVAIPAESRNILPGKKLSFEVILVSFGEPGKINATIEYLIKDLNGALVLNFTELIEFDSQYSFQKQIQLPEEMEPGDYVLFLKVNYLSDVTTSSELFSVNKKVVAYSRFLYASGIFAILFVLIIIFYEIRHRRLKVLIKEQSAHLNVIRHRITSGRMKAIEAVAEVRKLQLQKEILERAYRAGYIREAAHHSGMRNIGILTKKIKEKYL